MEAVSLLLPVMRKFPRLEMPDSSLQMPSQISSAEDSRAVSLPISFSRAFSWPLRDYSTRRRGRWRHALSGRRGECDRFYRGPAQFLNVCVKCDECETDHDSNHESTDILRHARFRTHGETIRCRSWVRKSESWQLQRGNRVHNALAQARVKFFPAGLDINF
jgi:hypothetical protein